jgi:hypothetical protein
MQSGQSAQRERLISKQPALWEKESQSKDRRGDGEEKFDNAVHRYRAHPIFFTVARLSNSASSST